MTKVIILGEQKENKVKEPIEFIAFLGSDCVLDYECSNSQKPVKWKNIELISRNYTDDGLDLMFAYDDTRDGSDIPTIFLGKFNDGVV